MRTKIINGRLITPYRILEGWELTLEGGVITSVGPREGQRDGHCRLLDAKGRYVAPGFIDLHTHGGGGYDFMDGTVEAFRGAAQAHARHGTTLLMPTSLAASDEEMETLFTCYARVKTEGTAGANLLGLHLEGPYFAWNQRGAQDPRYLRCPDPEHYGMMLRRGKGMIARWSAAPELPGAPGFWPCPSGGGYPCIYGPQRRYRRGGAGGHGERLYPHHPSLQHHEYHHPAGWVPLSGPFGECLSFPRVDGGDHCRRMPCAAPAAAAGILGAGA